MEAVLLKPRGEVGLAIHDLMESIHLEQLPSVVHLVCFVRSLDCGDIACPIWIQMIESGRHYSVDMRQKCNAEKAKQTI